MYVSVAKVTAHNANIVSYEWSEMNCNTGPINHFQIVYKHLAQGNGLAVNLYPHLKSVH